MSAPYYGVPVELLRVRVGLQPADASRDVEIEASFTEAILSINDYLDRVLQLGDQSKTETHFRGTVISLPAYPIELVVKLIADGDSPEFHVDKSRGLIMLDSSIAAHVLAVDYRGGYDIFPADIQAAAIATFDNVWQFMNSTSIAASSTAVTKSLAVDGMRVDYFDPNKGTSTKEPVGYIPASVIDSLEGYRRITA